MYNGAENECFPWRSFGIFLFWGSRICSSMAALLGDVWLHFWVPHSHLVLVFYASLNLPSTEVLVGEGCHISGEQADVIPPASRFWKTIWFSVWWFSSCSSPIFQHVECNCLECLRVPGGQAFRTGRRRGWDHLLASLSILVLVHW